MGAETRATHFMNLQQNFSFHPSEETPRPQIIQEDMQNMDYKLLLISVCVFHLSVHSQGRPLRKRTVSEVQLMHNLGEHKQLQERREWLQMRLRGIHTAAAAAAEEEEEEEEEEALGSRLKRRRLIVEELPQLKDFTPEEIQRALNFLEKLLQAKQA